MSFLLPANQEALTAVSNIWDSTAAQNPVCLYSKTTHAKIGHKLLSLATKLR